MVENEFRISKIQSVFREIGLPFRFIPMGDYKLLYIRFGDCQPLTLERTEGASLTHATAAALARGSRSS